MHNIVNAKVFAETVNYITEVIHTHLNYNKVALVENVTTQRFSHRTTVRSISPCSHHTTDLNTHFYTNFYLLNYLRTAYIRITPTWYIVYIKSDL